MNRSIQIVCVAAIVVALGSAGSGDNMKLFYRPNPRLSDGTRLRSANYVVAYSSFFRPEPQTTIPIHIGIVEF